MKMNVEEKNARIALAVQTIDDAMRQLAEECSELTQAALKYLRSFTQPYVDKEKAISNLIEEIGDVENIIAGTKAILTNRSYPDLVIDLHIKVSVSKDDMPIDKAMIKLAVASTALAQSALEYLESLTMPIASENAAARNLVEKIKDIEVVINKTKLLSTITEEYPDLEDRIMTSREFKVKRWADRIYSTRGIIINFDE